MINWNTRRYIATLSRLLTARMPGVRVEGMAPQRDPSALRDTLVEVEIERFEGQAAGALEVLDGELFASLVVTRRCDALEAETELLDTTLELATVLQDLRDQGAVGPAQVLTVEPEPLEGYLEQRIASWRVSFRQALRIERAGHVEEPAPYQDLYAGRSPNVGPSHRDDYARLVARS